MAYILGNGATVTVGSTTYSDAIEIGLLGKEGEKVDITNLGSAQKEYAISTIIDYPEVSVVVPYGTFPAISNTAVAFSVSHGGSVLVAGTCKVIGVIPGKIEVNGKLTMEIKVQPVSIT